MKYIEIDDLKTLPGPVLEDADTFSFRCHPQISCFNRCCRNLNLFLYPYDVIRLKNRLNLLSEAFIDAYTDIVLRPGSRFPDVLLRMEDNDEKTCPFLTEAGCRVYPDRPYTCRAFPVEHGVFYDAEKRRSRLVYFFRPPDFCQGRFETTTWTRKTWEADQQAAFYTKMTAEWAELVRLFADAPWGEEGPKGPKGKMAFMAAYNMDAFRDFVLNSSFLKRYSIKPGLRLKIKSDDVALLRLGISWIKLFLWGIGSTDLDYYNKA